MSNRPTHDLKLIRGEGDKAQFIQVTALWQTKDGTGYTGAIPEGMTITGRFGIFARKDNSK